MILRTRPRSSPFRQLLKVPSTARRSLVAPPRPNSGPLMERRADRDLPPLPRSNTWLRTLPIFGAIMVVCSFAIFNYEKANSSVVTSTLYALRKNPDARRLLGDEIYFAHNIPWIWGTINQLHGNVDISFSVRGTRGTGFMTFKSVRQARRGYVGAHSSLIRLVGGTRVVAGFST